MIIGSLGVCFFMRTLAASVGFKASPLLPDGYVVARVDLGVYPSAGGLPSIGLVLVGSPAETLENFQTGQSLVGRSDGSGGGQPSLLLDNVSGDASHVVLWSGLVTGGGSRHLLARCSPGGLVDMSLVVSALLVPVKA